mmetsp:Transcript_60560/g.172126  ORF Transcript_60560/g.172126 Transcript_60560/m.172126 type:complete len:300 (-) Transcript_60560:151-1050(-)|eukprot:CAMPEP_0168394918 /NCGR_PEP_ID=MMETSP0228-20121227/19780_1 /TAXON_ID=133427 /ORGANISM="Protoceratium reticulatum, Strain CCCM 535 (=CCMP 1889)" /LENGTH=299 /DNA_ID=CAMNT_0008408343 /DNA_START=39 /DNA_END=938 /DNA_ORIENTATION=-
MDWAAITPQSVFNADWRVDPSLRAAYAAVYPVAARWAALFVAVWVLALVVLRAAGCGKMLFGVRRGTWALKAVMLLHHSLVTPLALLAMWDDQTIRGMYLCIGCPSMAHSMNRDVQPSLAAQALTPMTLGYFIADLLLVSQWSLSRSGLADNLLMGFHHVASLLVWPATVYFDWVSRYVVILLSYEFSSVFLTVNWMLSAAGLKRTPLYFATGLLFTLSFVAVRLLGAVPQLRAMWCLPPWSGAVHRQYASGPFHSWQGAFSTTLLLPHAMNLAWGVKVVRGFLAVALGRSAKPAERQD